MTLKLLSGFNLTKTNKKDYSIISKCSYYCIFISSKYKNTPTIVLRENQFVCYGKLSDRNKINKRYFLKVNCNLFKCICKTDFKSFNCFFDHFIDYVISINFTVTKYLNKTIFEKKKMILEMG